MVSLDCFLQHSYSVKVINNKTTLPKKALATGTFLLLLWISQSNCFSKHPQVIGSGVGKYSLVVNNGYTNGNREAPENL